MNKKIVFIVLFTILYISVALVSTFHAISFFGLANITWVAILLAITFEIGQAAVLFSILTNASGKSKFIPWFLMSVLTLVQILGNVYSSYKYLITNSADLLRYFKEPIFVWTNMPDQQCNVILTYIIGAILPIVSLLMTSMVTNYLDKENHLERGNTIEKETNLDKENHLGKENNSENNTNNIINKHNENDSENSIVNNIIDNNTIDNNTENIEQPKSHFINI